MAASNQFLLYECAAGYALFQKTEGEVVGAGKTVEDSVASYSAPVRARSNQYAQIKGGAGTRPCMDRKTELEIEQFFCYLGGTQTSCKSLGIWSINLALAAGPE